MNELTGGITPQASTLAEAVASGKEFRVGQRSFKVHHVIRGSMSHILTPEVIPQIRRLRGNRYVMGLYGPEPPGPLLVAFELERVR